MNANKAVKDLSPDFKEKIRSDKAVKVELILPDYGKIFEFKAFGSKKLILSHDRDAVIRKSDYICSRTLLVRSEKAAINIDREFVNLLRDRKTTIVMRLVV